MRSISANNSGRPRSKYALSTLILVSLLFALTILNLYSNNRNLLQAGNNINEMESLKCDPGTSSTTSKSMNIPTASSVVSGGTTIEDFVGPPLSHWIGNSTWIPAEGSRMYTTDELRNIFSKECTLFVGDSLQRRLADTLHLLLSIPNYDDDVVAGNITSNTSEPYHTPVVDESIFTDEYFKQKTHDRGFRKRNIWMEKIVNSSKRTGCIDTDWRPLLENIIEFADDFQNNSSLYGEYTVVVIGSTIWDVVGSSRVRTSAKEIRNKITNAFMKLAQKIPLHVKIIWKSAGWCSNCPWTIDENRMGRGDNYKVYAANKQAQMTLWNLTSTSESNNFYFVDWGREVLPRSISEHRLSSNDGNPYHYGLIPRLVGIQMIAEQYDIWHSPTLTKGAA